MLFIIYAFVSIYFENNLPKDKYEKQKNVKTNGYLHKVM